jgi:hypothetical protein
VSLVLKILGFKASKYLGKGMRIIDQDCKKEESSKS